MEKGSASGRKPPLPPRRQRIDAKPSAAAGKPPLPPRRKRPQSISVSKSGETSNRAWIADQLRSEDSYIKLTVDTCMSMVKVAYNVRGEWADDWNVDLAQFVIAKVQSVEHRDHDQSALSFPEEGHHLHLLYLFVRYFALLLLSLCKVDQNLWSDHLAHHFIQFILMKLHSSTHPLQSLDAHASPSKKLKGS
ncbi:uncharacterized protein LOC125205365 isoform X1 [Salvia hispanica]|uniref:uncharacterized protein LOC125205365 isoform X1 n=1 Tax=Salvia hispanica TaxID=49212 RepID=UPI0020096A76|nr:uncharacterized protein LOC125205365 isoform X1 [Salvia hispanica]